MAWFGDGLPSLSNLKGQITNFTKEVLSEGIVEEVDQRTRELNDANERCVQLQEILNTKDAEISLLRRQNCELQKTVVELNTRTRESNDGHGLDDDGGGGFFWDPPPVRNVSKNTDKTFVLQEQLSQATVRIRELEEELKILRVNSGEVDGHRKAEFLRAKQDMVNRIIQIGEKGRDAERNLRKIPLDEAGLINDFRSAISQLDSQEQFHVIKSALKALESQRDDSKHKEDVEKFDVHEKREKFDRPRLESVSLISHNDDIDIPNGFVENGNPETNGYREMENLRQRVQELQKENEFLTTSLDELDKEHSQSLETILLMKDQLSKKHESLQKAYEQLYVEYNESQTKLQELASKPSVETNNNRISENRSNEIMNEDKQVQTEITPSDENVKTEIESKDVQTEETSTSTIHVQTMKIENEHKGCQIETKEESSSSEDSSRLEDLTQRVNEILKNTHLETQEDESMFESLAKQYVEAHWKKELLERKVTDVSRELKDTSEMRDSLQIECYDMQTTIESLLLQIEHLKSNLPSIPEASEERVAFLETETDSLVEKIKRLESEYGTLQANHCELVRNTSILEGTLRNQENLEAELRNTKQQLNIAQQQLDGASKNVENNENMMEDLARRVHASLEENNELRKKIEILEIAETRASKEKVKMSEDHEAAITLLENKISEVTEKLNESQSTIKSLENDLRLTMEAKNELEKDIETISSEKERLETERFVLRENSSEKETGDLLQSLQDQLDSANQEKNDLEYDLINMRKELDVSLSERSSIELESEKLATSNAKLVQQNNELFDQLSSNEKESSERIELLQTEMNLLNQEYNSLKSELSLEKLETSKYREQLADSEAKRASLEQELALVRGTLETLKVRCTALENHSGDVEKISIKLLDEEKKCKELETLLNSMTSERNVFLASREENEKKILELTETMKELESSREKALENAVMAKETIENLSQLIRHKEDEIENLKSTVATEIEKKHNEEENALSSLKSEREDLVKLVQEKHNTSLQYYAEIQRLAQLVTEQTTNLQRVMIERDEKLAILAQKEAEILWSQNELQVVRQRLKSLEESQNNGEICNVAEHSRQIAQASMLNEKCNALEAALIQEQSNNRIIQNQLTESQAKEANAAKELERLRTHLVEMEASYTEETLIAEETRKQLEAKLHQAEEKAQNSSTVYTSASIRANQQVETLQQQVALIVQQRDEIQMKLSAAEDKVLSNTAALTNLQIVLEQFQRDKENDIRTATEKLRQQLNMSFKDQEDLRNEIVNLKTQLSEAKECLQAASRLSEQLDKKSERINELNQEVMRLTELVNTADQRIQEAKSSEEGKVDKNLVKNLLLGFLTSSTMDKSSVLRVFATVLDFDEAEKDKLGLNHPTANTGWFSGLLGNAGSPPTKDQEASLSAAFVRFLESESKPKPQLPALTISNSSLKRPGHSRQHSSSSTQSGLLLSNITLPSFPDFVPSRNTGSILKEVLKDS